MSNKAIARELKKLGVDLNAETVGLILGVVGDVTGGNGSKKQKRPIKRGRADLEVDDPEDFLVEVSILVPACLARNGQINLFPDEIEDLAEEIEEAIKDYQEDLLTFHVFSDEDSEPFELQPGARLVILEGER